MRQDREFSEERGRGSDLYRSGNLVNKGPVVRKCRDEGGGKQVGRAGVIFFFLCRAALASSLFMRLPASVELSCRSLPPVVGGSGT